MLRHLTIQKRFPLFKLPNPQLWYPRRNLNPETSDVDPYIPTFWTWPWTSKYRPTLSRCATRTKFLLVKFWKVIPQLSPVWKNFNMAFFSFSTLRILEKFLNWPTFQRHFLVNHGRAPITSKPTKYPKVSPPLIALSPNETLRRKAYS